MYTIDDITEYCRQNKCNCCPLNRGSAYKCEFKQKPSYWDKDKIKKEIKHWKDCLEPPEKPDKTRFAYTAIGVKAAPKA